MAENGKSIETARHGVPLKEIIVDFAHITCTCAQCPPNILPIEERSARLFHVGSGHGVQQGGHHCAHDQSCIPITNIPNFGSCHSEQYFSALEALMERHQLSGSGISAQENAENASAHQEAVEAFRGGYVNGKCLLRLLDRWFDADEHNTVNDYFDLTSSFLDNILQFNGEFMKCFYALEAEVINAAKKNTDDELDGPMYGLPYTELEQSKSNVREKYQTVKSAKEDAQKLDKEIKDISIKMALADENFTAVKADLGNILSKLDAIDRKVDKAMETTSEENKVKYSSNYKKCFNDLRQSIVEAKSGIDNLIPKEYHLLKMDSFLVCKLGGILEFQTSGQERLESFTSLYQTMLNEFNALKSYIGAAPKGAVFEEITNAATLANNDHDQMEEKVEGIGKNREDTYNEAIKEIDKFIAFANGTSPVNKATDSYFEIKFVSHKVTEQNGKTLAALAILSSIPGANGLLGATQIALSWGLVVIDVMGYVKNGLSWEAIGDATTVGAIAEANNMMPTSQMATNTNLAVALTINLPKLFYTSLDDWIEFMEIRMQCKDNLFISRQTLDKNGKATGTPDFMAPMGDEKHRLWNYEANEGKATLDLRNKAVGGIKTDDFGGEASAREAVIPDGAPCPNSCQ